MATLVSNIELQKFLGETSVDMTSFITMADLIITEDLAATTLTVARKKQIVLLLAAHFYSVIRKNGGLTREVIGDTEEHYQARSNDLRGLATTLYGQQALALDNSGILAQYAAQSVTAKFRVV